MNFQLLHKQKKIILIASATGIIAVFLPWLKVNMFMFNKTVNGFNGLGILTFIAFVVCLLMCLVNKEKQHEPLDNTKWLAALILLGLSLLIISYTIYSAANFSSTVDEATDFFGDEVKQKSKDFLGGNFGIGIWLALFSAIAALGGTWFFKDAKANINNAFSSIKIPNISLGNTNATVDNNQNKYKELEQLMELKNKGILTDEEFNAQKSKLLN
jgi:hypothetical protein